MKLTTCLWFAAPVVLAIAFKPMPGNKPGDGGKKRLFFDKAGMDTTVKPGDNFFLYANGGWIKKTEIPPALTGWGSFFVLNEQNTANLHHLLDSVSKFSNPEGSVSQKVADFYYSGMDTVSIEKLGYDPIKPQLAKINAVTNYKQLVQLAADGFKTGNGFLFGFSIGADDKQSTKNAVELHQTGLTLPNRDYYLKTDSNSVNIRKKYVAYIAKMLNLTGTPQAEAATQADEILALETAIAKSHRSPVELRDPIANYNKYSFAAFEKQMPDVDLKDAFMRIGVVPDSVIIGQPR
jgi:putative endopeptidase